MTVTLLGPHMADGYTDASRTEQGKYVSDLNAGAVCIMRAQNEQQALWLAQDIKHPRFHVLARTGKSLHRKRRSNIPITVIEG